MKKSKIIIAGLFIILLITIVILQFKFKSYLNNYEITKIELEFNPFNNLEVENGWYVEFHEDSLIKVTVNSDSLRNLISLNNDTLILSKTGKDTDHRLKVQISGPDINQISLSGNSIVNYYSDEIDSLNVNLRDKSNLDINGEKSDDTKTKSQSKIDFLRVVASNKSSINIHGDIREFKGELKDSSYCHLPGNVNLKDFIKSENANINSW